MLPIGQYSGQLRNPFQPLLDHLMHGLPGNSALFGKFAQVQGRNAGPSKLQKARETGIPAIQVSDFINQIS